MCLKKCFILIVLFLFIPIIILNIGFFTEKKFYSCQSIKNSLQYSHLKTLIIYMDKKTTKDKNYQLHMIINDTAYIFTMEFRQCNQSSSSNHVVHHCRRLYLTSLLEPTVWFQQSKYHVEETMINFNQKSILECMFKPSDSLLVYRFRLNEISSLTIMRRKPSFPSSLQRKRYAINSNLPSMNSITTAYDLFHPPNDDRPDQGYLIFYLNEEILQKISARTLEWQEADVFSSIFDTDKPCMIFVDMNKITFEDFLNFLPQNNLHARRAKRDLRFIDYFIADFPTAANNNDRASSSSQLITELRMDNEQGSKAFCSGRIPYGFIHESLVHVWCVAESTVLIFPYGRLDQLNVPDPTVSITISIEQYINCPPDPLQLTTASGLLFYHQNYVWYFLIIYFITIFGCIFFMTQWQSNQDDEKFPHNHHHHHHHPNVVPKVLPKPHQQPQHPNRFHMKWFKIIINRISGNRIPFLRSQSSSSSLSPPKPHDHHHHHHDHNHRHHHHHQHQQKQQNYYHEKDGKKLKKLLHFK
ncbi:uncharacterized protein LOC142597377 [Dermatophagoides farinae]|uniref:uncharacterized protein LOC142597377 n=1 Tax=Dermatophagoides farinae TaxID=6954 RepID=UPI003F5FF8D0